VIAETGGRAPCIAEGKYALARRVSMGLKGA
jgi:hypothetical protein